MIVGIDETGDFNPNEDKLNFFTAVLIDQNKNKYAIKKGQYNVWESSIPSTNRDISGEVKGRLLTDEQLTDFYNQVLKPSPTVLYCVIVTNPIDSPVEVFEKHKKIEVERIEAAIKYYENNARISWVEGYKNILYWYKNRNYQQLLKNKLLVNLVGQSFNFGFGYSQLMYLIDEKDDSNIQNFSFIIDKDFIKAENTKNIWNEILRQFWTDFNKSNKTISIGLNSPDLNVYDLNKGKASLKKVFRERTKFVDSKDFFEVRMADIVGTILHRHLNKKRCDVIGKEILKHLGGKSDNYIRLVLNDI